MEKKQSILKHLSELRRRLVIVLAAHLAAAGVCFTLAQPILRFVLLLDPGFELVYLAPSELFSVYIQVSLFCAVILCLPLTIYEIWMFVARGLYRREKLYVASSLLFSAFFFAAGAAFAYLVVLPVTLDFFLRIQMQGVSPMISVAEFVAFVSSMVAAFGVVFEMPVAAALLSALGVLRPGSIRKRQPILIVAIFVTAAAITPPDVVSQLMLALPMTALLQLSIGICWLIERNRNRRLADAAPAKPAPSAAGRGSFN